MTNLERWQRGLQRCENADKNCGQAIEDIINAWSDYAYNYRRQFNSVVGNDGYLGDPFADIGKALLHLLNGPIGQKDGRTLDREIRQVFVANGFNDEGNDEERQSG